jgi:hypothetical protein
MSLPARYSGGSGSAGHSISPCGGGAATTPRTRIASRIATVNCLSGSSSFSHHFHGCQRTGLTLPWRGRRSCPFSEPGSRARARARRPPLRGWRPSTGSGRRGSGKTRSCRLVSASGFAAGPAATVVQEFVRTPVGQFWPASTLVRAGGRFTFAYLPSMLVRRPAVSSPLAPAGLQRRPTWGFAWRRRGPTACRESQYGQSSEVIVPEQAASPRDLLVALRQYPSSQRSRCRTHDM